ncbi:hypothetical protein [Mangrovicoccus ximenensis]|uniref:hypothetical protein n=1 Tax=Mangrovicoccus ximenensis TaxID=1911570 RepID=UPI0011AE80D1|nr:hypothetical protein [Mangrovicoccus ximenensis]
MRGSFSFGCKREKTFLVLPWGSVALLRKSRGFILNASSNEGDGRSLTDILKGRAKNPRIDTLEKIAVACEVTIFSLVTLPTAARELDDLLRYFSMFSEKEQRLLVATARAWTEVREA